MGLLYRLFSFRESVDYNKTVNKSVNRMPLPKGSLLDIFTESLLTSFRCLRNYLRIYRSIYDDN